MKHHFKQGNPVVGSRASVAQWNLSIEFKTKEQCQLIMNEIMKLGIDVPIKYEAIWDDVGFTHTLIIGDMSWGSNIVLIGKIIDKFDYNQGV